MTVEDEVTVEGHDRLGRSVQMRLIGPPDAAALHELYTSASTRSIQRRFFTASRQAAFDYAVREAQSATDAHRCFGAFWAGELIGVVDWERTSEVAAEVGLLVLDPQQHIGVGTLLLRRALTSAFRAGIRTVVAEVLPYNAEMIDVLEHLGLPWRRRRDADCLEIELTLGGQP
ncbi:MAG: GNAT family N-acetyltransferase [Jatrophihabitans sp.]|uniref:GNAT family N-acetyltransferase n=1 Tax=Jatrophihabitans sp. TaxID=1932789 RepID=UPI003F7DBDB7